MTSSPLPKRLAIAVLAAAALAGGAAGTASADSFAYVKGGDVWLTTTDGARQFQVTGTADYTSISQADDGTLLATTTGNHLRRLDRLGTVLSDIPTPISQSVNGTSVVFDGPEQADISPDGRTVGYGFMKWGTYQYPDGTRDADLYNGNAFTRSDALTGFTDPGYKYSRDWDAPEFIDDQTVLVSNGPGYPSTPFAIEKVGSGDPQSWFSDGNNMHPEDATISRDKRYIAAVHGPDRKTLEVYRVGDQKLMSSQLSDCFTYSDPRTPDIAYNSPTFNADGTRLAWGSNHGLYIAPIGDGSAHCPDGQVDDVEIAGGTSPDWGLADVPASRPASNPLPTHGGGAAPAPGGANPGSPAPGTGTIPPTPVVAKPAPVGGSGSGALDALAVKATPARLRATLSGGLRLTVTVPAPGKVAVVARSGGRKVGAGAATAKAAGKVSVKVTFAKAAARKLRRARKATVNLTVSAGGATQTLAVTLKR